MEDCREPSRGGVAGHKTFHVTQIIFDLRTLVLLFTCRADRACHKVIQSPSSAVVKTHLMEMKLALLLPGFTAGH